MKNYRIEYVVRVWYLSQFDGYWASNSLQTPYLDDAYARCRELGTKIVEVVKVYGSEVCMLG